MRFAIAAAALALGAQGELLHDKFHRAAANHGRSNATSTTPAVPGPSNSTVPVPPGNSTGCVDLTSLVAGDWQAADTSAWLDNWWKTNEQAIAQNGFISTFGSLILNDPTWTCTLNGTCTVPCVPMQKASASLGALRARANVPPNNNGGSSSSNNPGDSQAGGNVAASLSNLQAQFDILYGILDSAGTQTSLDIDSIVQNFWKDPAGDSQMELMQGLRAFAMIVGIAASFATGGAAIPAAAGSAILGGSITLGLGSMPGAGEPKWVKSGDVGHEIAQFISASEHGLQDLYNMIADGKPIGDSNVDLRTVLSDGSYLSSHRADITENMTSAMKSTVINYLWRQGRIFILGGASCGENQGIGNTGSHEGYEMIWWCDDENKAWYLYQFSDDAAANEKHPRVDRPWGADRMGENSYLSTHGGESPFWPELNPWNIVISSVKSYKVAGLNYTNDLWHTRVDDMFRAGSNPWFESNAMEGLWTIPVCNIAQTVDSDFKGKEHILKPYGWDSLPMWCGAICDNDEDATNAFFKAANFNLGKNPFAENCG
ncbi:hypothetical protein FE257_007030 [Aspergillus nanangensis]|uniref:Uncharacterized protein n=1 Tax=Aspergillus nanangensis TaxID=2582783 RepID=A0AAD4GTM7_ASPNN|nr:hypothetical protein FE257_007030 [Aspergillus nanangensis]